MRRSRLFRRTPLARVSKRKRAQDRAYVEVRRQVFDRAHGRCEVCAGRAQHAHHLVPRSAGGLDVAQNLLAVCLVCHRRIHDNPQWAREHGYLRSRWAA